MMKRDLEIAGFVQSYAALDPAICTRDDDSLCHQAREHR